MSDLGLSFDRDDMSHLAGSPIAYCLEGVRYTYDGNTLIVRRGDCVHSAHPAVLQVPWAFASEPPTDLSAPLDDLDDDQDNAGDGWVDPDDPDMPGPEIELPEVEGDVDHVHPHAEDLP